MVFPSRRATVFFKDALRRQNQALTSMPAVLAFEDFVRELSRKTIVDKVSQTFELYPFYKEVFPDEPFDKFYSWGSIMVSDFDEIDRYLVDAEALFVNLSELKKLDTTIESWSNEGEGFTEFQLRYLKFWDQLGPLYKQLRAHLRESELASEAMALRDLAESFQQEIPPMIWEKVIFAGFNALTPAEESLMQALVSAEKGEWYWDMDVYFTEDERQEAGEYFRKLRKKQPRAEWNWTDDLLQTQEKKIEITGVPRRAGQAKIAGLLLQELALAESLGRKTALVLPDESLLFPLLHSLPESVKDINVTMGFPLKHTPLYTLVESIINLHENADRLRPDSKSTVYYFRDVRKILRHPYIHRLIREEFFEINRTINQGNLIYISPSFFKKRLGEEHPVTFIFQPWEDLQSAVDWFLALYNLLREALEKPEDGKKYNQTLELEFLYQFHITTQKMKDKLERFSLNLELGTFRRLYREIIHNTNIPFAGEPLKGLQVMGMLETRVLDFDRLIMLSVNEKKLPAATQDVTFIPYSIRKADKFQLPVKEDQDALYAYHFYRLLKRAKDVRLVYDTEHDSMGTGEKSRFIAQMQAELLPKNPNIQFTEKTLSFNLNRQPVIPIKIRKDHQVIEHLKKRCEEKGLSPSSILQYLKCPLSFYFRYITRIHESDDAEEKIQANTFGNIAHQTLETLYMDYKGKTVTAEMLEQLKPKISDTIHAQFKEITHSYNLNKGRNLVLKEVIADMVEELLELDKTYAPFELKGLEEEIRVPFEISAYGFKVNLQGHLDRLDQRNGLVCISDYKTGRFKSEKIQIKKADDYHDEKGKREGFQLAMYAWLYMASHPEVNEVKSGIYPLRNLTDGVQWLSIMAGDIFDHNSKKEFEEELIRILTDMFDPEQLIEQTEDEDNCKYCNYKEMCVRQ